MATTDQIRLELPAEPGYGRVARIAATHLARRRGFSTRELEDLRTVVEEAVEMLGTGDPSATMRVDYSGDADTVVVDLSLLAEAGADVPPERIERFAEMAADLVDDYTVESGSARVRFTKKKA